MRPASEAGPNDRRLDQIAASIARTGRELLVAEGPEGLSVERVAALGDLDPAVIAHFVADDDALVALVLDRWDPADPLRRMAIDELTHHQTRQY